MTKFSKYLAEALTQDLPVYIGLLDEYINMRLEEEDGLDTAGFKQMVQLDKRVHTPFSW